MRNIFSMNINNKNEIYDSIELIDIPANFSELENPILKNIFPLNIVYPVKKETIKKKLIHTNNTNGKNTLHILI